MVRYGNLKKLLYNFKKLPYNVKTTWKNILEDSKRLIMKVNGSRGMKIDKSFRLEFGFKKGSRVRVMNMNILRIFETIQNYHFRTFHF